MSALLTDDRFFLHNPAQKIVNEHFQMCESPGDSSIMQGENCSHPGLRCKRLRPSSTSFIESLPHSPSSTMSLGQVISVWVINFFPNLLSKLAVFFPLGKLAVFFPLGKLAVFFPLGKLAVFFPLGYEERKRYIMYTRSKV